MKRFFLTPDAEADLLEIAAYIAQASPRNSKMVVRKIRAAIRRLATHPGIGHHRLDLTDQALRFWPVYSYLIVYREAIKPLQVIRILHGARDLAGLLRRYKA
jgi:antitoxin ParD1/3/4/toxin ParE1/3/4